MDEAFTKALKGDLESHVRANFGKPAYDALKATYDPTGTFKDLYTKVAKN